MKNIAGNMRKAIQDYNMISDGDKIAIALSGGKDSITMMYKLKELQHYYPKKFDLIAININPGFEGFDITILQDHCDKLEIPLIVYDSNIKEIVFDIRNEKNPCSLCANLRRGMLSSIAIENNCNKIAIGHNEDDVIETFLMNLVYAGNISTISPTSYMDRSNLTIIRPMIYVAEKDAKSYCKKFNLQLMPKVCPKDGASTREWALNLLKNLELTNKSTRVNFMGAIKRAHINGWTI